MSDRMVGHNGPMTDHGAGQRAATERPSGIATVVVAVLAIGSVAAAAIRAMPNMGSPDRGVFVSTAERMVAGDRLYVDVWDNKDPVFYYLMAAGRLVSPLMDYVLEVGWLAVVAVATYALARRVSGATLPAVLAAATGLVAVTGAAYIAGYTYLPGTALVLVVAALTADRRDVWVGVAFGVLLFTKPMMAPLALVALAPWWWRTRSVRSVGRMAAGLAPVAVAFVVLLAARGELGGWVAAQLDNVGYSQQRLRDNGQNPVIDHLSRVIGAHEIVMLALLTVVGVAIVWWSRRRADAASRDAATLAVAMLATAVMSVLVIAATGLGPWHNQLIQPAAVQAAALLAVPAAWLLQRPVTAVACLLLAPIAGWALGGAATVSDYRDSARFYRGSIGVLLQVPADAQSILALGPTGTYARLGGEYDDGHAHGLGGWRLACPRFHQYFFQPASTLQPVLACVATAPVVLVSPTFAPRPADMQTPDWNAFVQQGEELLAADYDCVAHEGFRLCTRKTG